jgi:predicted membrane protein
MSDNIEYNNSPRNGKALVGIILLAVGTMLLLRQFSFFFIPHWIFSFPMVLIVLGLFLGARNNFHKPGSILLILLGIVLLINDNVEGSHDIVWPLAIIVFGAWLILRRHSHFDKDYWKQHYGNKWDWRNYSGGFSPNNPGGPATGDPTASATPPNAASGAYGSPDDYLDAVSIFGGVKKTILSKDFKGGEIVNVFGGAELDFTQAEINGRVIIDITQIFGGTKIIVPSHWQVISDMAAVFAGLDDKRIKNTMVPNSERILVLKGVSIFAGIDIRSF